MWLPVAKCRLSLAHVWYPVAYFCSPSNSIFSLLASPRDVFGPFTVVICTTVSERPNCSTHLGHLVAYVQLHSTNLEGRRVGRSPYNPPPPSRRAGCQRRVEHFCRLLQTPKPQTDPALPADRTLRYPSARLLPTLGRQMSDFWLTFCRSKIHLKSDPSKNVPKSQKSDP